jgi:C4-dicarboxylate-binding protein DctP
VQRRLGLCVCAGVAFFLTGAIGLFSASAVAASPERVIRLSHVVAEDTPKGLAAQRFKVLVDLRSQGRIRVDVYPNASLYGDRDEMEAIQLGAVEMLAPSLSKFGRVGFPEFEVFGLPFLFDDQAAVHRVTQGPIGRKLLEGLSRLRLVGLGYLDNGFKQMSAQRALRDPEDYVGMNMRVQASRVIAAQMRALGARAVTLPFSETRRALAQGVVDGTENPVSNFWTQGMNEVQTDLTLTNHGYLGYAVVVNQRFWEQMPLTDRRLVAQAMDEALAYGSQIAQTQNDKALAQLRAAGTTRIHTIGQTQRARLKAAVAPVYAELASAVGQPLVDGVVQAAQSEAGTAARQPH